MSRRRIALVAALALAGAATALAGCGTAMDKAGKLYGWGRHRPARILAERACDQGDARGCGLAAAMWNNGEGGDADASRAMSYGERACSGGIAQGCGLVGMLLVWKGGTGSEDGMMVARDYLGTACEGGDLEACSQLGVMALAGQGGSSDPAEARDVFGEACEKGCARACNNRGAMLLLGKGGAEDKAGAWDSFEKACEAGSARACDNLGDMFFAGNGVPRNEDKARKYFAMACDLGEEESCKDPGAGVGGGEGIGHMLSIWRSGEPCVPDLSAAVSKDVAANGKPATMEERKEAAARKAALPTKVSAASPGESIVTGDADGGAKRVVWLVITRPMFEEAIAPLVAHRKEQGLEAMVSTLAPKKAMASLGGRRPGFVLIVGDDQAGAKKAPWRVATESRKAPAWQSGGEGGYASDALIGDLDGDLVPDVPVGRIPVRTAEELGAVVAKILAYEGKEPGIDDLRLPVWAGSAEYDPEVDEMAAALAVTILQMGAPPWMEPWLVAGDAGSPACGWPAKQAEAFNAQVERGGAIIGLIGHSSATAFHSMDFQGTSIDYGAGLAENVRPADDPAPPMVVIACDAGDFTGASAGLAEALLLTPGGPVAVIGATTESHPITNYYSSLALLKVLGAPSDGSIGKLWLETQDMSTRIEDPMFDMMLMGLDAGVGGPGGAGGQIDMEALRRDHLLMYALLGDPATRMRLPGKLHGIAEILDDGCHWQIEKPEGAVKLYVQMRDTGKPFPDNTDVAGLGEKAAMALSVKANSTFAFRTFAEMGAGEEWAGVAEKRGVLRLVAVGPGRIWVTTLMLQ